MVKIEARAYGPDSTEEEKQAIRDRIRIRPDGIVHWDEMPVGGIYHLTLFDEQFSRLLEPGRQYGMIVNLTGVGRPNAAYRDALRDYMTSIHDRFYHIAIVTGKGPLINLSAKIVVSIWNLWNFSLETTYQDAEDKLEHVLRKQASVAQ
ncbi:hypothetical protein [Pontibacter sp. G13]|uniref:hypothetical protein n=1 Tax=Pontibacter sp. G13 TaxID=3074898 RepID=UPI00288B4096|nr:hypothetical protein [Pontibacter sp. G13]WNJ17256.1 hypothetical protein RJD25_20565 [Pontibacter sp. G13]